MLLASACSTSITGECPSELANPVHILFSLINERIHLTTREVLATNTGPSDGNQLASIANTTVMITIKGKSTKRNGGMHLRDG